MSLLYPWVRRSGPYEVSSCANGEIRIKPKWPQYPVWNKRDGGGPGLSGRLCLAKEMEWLLNAYVAEKKAVP